MVNLTAAKVHIISNIRKKRTQKGNKKSQPRLRRGWHTTNYETLFLQDFLHGNTVRSLYFEEIDTFWEEFQVKS